MAGWVWRTTVRQGSRWGTLFLTLVVASFGFAMLTAQSVASRLDVVQTADANARSAYDILVRPVGSRLALEGQRGLVQPGFLDADEGISLAQWRRIQEVPGVEVAAPIAVVGWVVPTLQAPVDLSVVRVTPTTPTLLRRTATWTYDNGASTVRAAPALEYLTTNPMVLQSDTEARRAWINERMPDGQVRRHALDPTQQETVTDPSQGYTATCVEPRATCRFWFHSVQPGFPYPFLMVAVDPQAEARLAGLDRALTGGAYLTDAEPQVGDISTAQDGSDERNLIPVLVADAPTMELSVSYRVEDLGPEAATRAAAGQLPGEGAAGRLVSEGTWTAETAYQELVGAMRTPGQPGEYYATSIRDVFRTGPAAYSAGVGGGLVAEAASGDRLGWTGRGDIAGSLVPPGGDDTAFHELSGFVSRGEGRAAALQRVGTFDATRLVGSQLSAVPLGTYAFSPPTGADDRSRGVLGGQEWQPSANIGGFAQAPPMMVTSLSALPAFSDPSAWAGVGRGGVDLAGVTPVGADPLSAVRVRVAGVSGVDEASRERVRLVAEQIAMATGLEVDITMGSSPAPQRITVPAGEHGRPAIDVNQNWVQKGVAVALVSAADRKSLLLNAAILVVSGVVVNNAALASVRARRRQLATLLLTGWSRGAVLRAELGALMLVSAAAGVLAGVGAWLAGVITSTPVSLVQAALAVPAAMLVALLAGLAAATVASRTPALEAVRPTGGSSRGSVARPVRGIGRFAVRSVLAAPGRAALTGAAVAVATAALAVLLVIQLEFSGQAVGTLLGNAIALQVRGPDLVAVAGILVLAGVGVGHAGALEVRDRASELVMLRVAGWRDGHLSRLIVTQGLIVGIAGALVGAGAALWFAHQVLGGATPTAWLASAAAGLAGVASAVLGSLAPARLLARTPATVVLAEE